MIYPWAVTIKRIFFLQHCFWILKAKNVAFLFYGLISVAYVA